MASLPVHGAMHLSRLTTAARLARIAPAAPVRIDPPHVITTERLTLRPLEWRDREELARAVSDTRDAAADFCPLHKPGESDDQLFDRLLELGRAAGETGRAWRRIAEDAAGRIVGAINLNDVSFGIECRAELNLWVRTTTAARGLGTEMVQAAIRHAFRPQSGRQMREGEGLLPGLGLTRIDALVAPENFASLALVRRLGFVVDPDAPSAQLTLNEQLVEHTRYVLWCENASAARSIDDLPPRFARSLDSVLRIEAAAAHAAPS